MTKRAALLISIAIVLILGLYSAWLYTFTLPEHLQVNGETFNLVPSDNIQAGLFGETICGTRTIMLSAKLDKGDQAAVVMHEVMHALTCLDTNQSHDFLYNNGPDTDGISDHPGIAWAGPHLASFIAENPKLAAFLVFHGKKLSHVEVFYAGGDGGNPFPEPKTEVLK